MEIINPARFAERTFKYMPKNILQVICLKSLSVPVAMNLSLL